MGTSTACGHYVAHVKNDQAVGEDETEWLIFNDNKDRFILPYTKITNPQKFYKKVSIKINKNVS